MSERDPKRLKEGDAPDSVRALLRSAETIPAMTAEDRAALLAGLVTMEPPAAPAPKPLAGAAAKAALSVVAVTLVGAAIALSGHALVTSSRAPSKGGAPPGPAVRTEAPREVEPAPTSSEPTGTPVPLAPTPSTDAVPPPVPRAAPNAARANSRPGAPGAPDDSLAAESALVARARASQDAREILAIADEHAKRFPRGELAPEREYLAIKALSRLGRTDDMKQRAQRFLSLYPSSPYAATVRALLRQVGSE